MTAAQPWLPTVLFVPAQGGLCRGWREPPRAPDPRPSPCSSVASGPAHAPRGAQPRRQPAALGGGGGPRGFGLCGSPIPPAPLFCLLSLCRETPQGLFPPAPRAFGAGAVTEGPQQPAPRLKLVLGWGWRGVKSPCTSRDEPDRGALSSGAQTRRCRHSTECPCCAAAAARQPCGSRRRLRGEWDARLFLER